MGSPLSGTMAEIFLQHLEDLHIKPLLDSKCIMFYSRYVYDIVIIYDANRTKPEHILQNQHEYGTIAETMTLLKPVQNESMLLLFEQFHIQSLHQAGKLIPEQCPSDLNPFFQLTFNHPPPTHHKTEPVAQQPSNRTHNPQLHTIPTTCKPRYVQLTFNACTCSSLP